MRLDPASCYRALRTRDPRFDGRFFVGVRSTGIYCRPICPAPTPRAENCEFLPCAAAAQEAGYRPCLRCRPEAAPGTPAWRGASAVVARALRLIEEGGLDTAPVGELALRLGIGERHLRRLFVSHVGASPRSVARTRRLLFAKRLIDETHLPMTEIAQAAGYTSVRRFNEAVRESYGRPPRELRQRRTRPRAEGRSEDTLALRLSFRPPFAWPQLARFFGERAVEGLEAVHDGVYQRGLALEGRPGRGRVEVSCEAGQLVARIRWSGPAPLLELSERLRRLFDLEADPLSIEEALARDPALAARLAQGRGIRVPGAWDGFELGVRAILGQQVSVAAAARLAAHLVERFGEPLPPELATPALRHCFPTARALAEADLAELPMPRSRRRALWALARAVADGALCLEPSGELEPTLAALRALPGVGDWTAQVIAMRALRDPDALPVGDLGLRRALGLEAPALAKRAEAWRPWRAYAAVLLWSRPGAPSDA